MAAELVDNTVKIYIKKVADLLLDVAIPIVTNAYVSNIDADGHQYMITTKWSQKNYKVNKTDEFSLCYLYNRQEGYLKRVCSPLSSIKPMLETMSPSLKQRAVVLKHVNETSKKDEYILEVWSHTERVKTINLSSYDMHGQVHSDVLFGALCWSQDEMKIVYVAEKKKAKVSGYFQKSVGNPENDEAVQGEKFDYQENWGEQLTDVTNTVLCVLTLSDESLKIVDGIPENLSPLQPEFATNDLLVFAAFDKSPFKLGVIYCENRPCGIYQVKLDEGETTMQLPGINDLSANYHPHLNKSGDKLVFLQRQLSGQGDPHRGSCSLVIYDFKNKTTKLLCSELSYGGKTFPMFVLGKNLKYNFWLPDDIHIAIPNTLEGRQYLCVVDTESGTMKSMTECSNFFGMHNGLFLASKEKLNSLNSCIKVIDCNKTESMCVTEFEKFDDELVSDSFIDEHGLTSIYMMPKPHSDMKEGFPLIVSPHGGPHSTFTNDFSRNARLFCKLGYALLLVNFRGSTGFTNASLNSLPGNVGTQDVQDVQNIVNKFISLKDNFIDKQNIFVCGGSHGGFLGAHLIGQFPDFYKAAGLRNPVIEFSSMSVESDIPDWTYFESGVPYTQSTILSSETSTSMISKSPINHVANIKAPVLLCIGGKDARVPPAQGKYFFKVLKANKKTVKMLYYPDDSHPLSSVETEADNVINICKWFYQHGTHSRT